MRKALTYLAFIALCMGTGAAIGAFTRPDAWYFALNKPWFVPPPWVFGVVWPTLFVLIGIAGARTYLAGADMRLWITQFILNMIWSPVFFTLQSIVGGLVISVLMWIVIIAFIVKRWPEDRIAAAAFIPYACWVTFANIINGTLIFLN